MRVTAFVFLIVAALTGAATAQAPVFDDPVALVQHVYEPYLAGSPATMEAKDVYSPTLVELFTLAAGDGRLTFDPVVNGADYAVTDLQVTLDSVEDGKALVAAAFGNGHGDQQLVYTLLRLADGWKIDDIESVQPGGEWRLSTILAADPMLN